jgi:ABC-type metal ion transport system substrate-binding protein
MLIRFGIKYANFFEPLAKYGISYYLNGQLKKYKQQGLVSTYKTHTKRLGKWNYKIEVDLDLTPKQFIHVLNDLFNQLKSIGR